MKYNEKFQSYRDIRTFEDVLSYLNITQKQWDSLKKLSYCIEFEKWVLIMKVFIKITNDSSTLTEGYIYYPYAYITWNNPNNSTYSITPCKINNREAFLVGGSAYSGGSAGLGDSFSYYPVSSSGAYIGWRGFSSRDVAEHISKYFSKELIEVIIGWRTNEIEWI